MPRQRSRWHVEWPRRAAAGHRGEHCAVPGGRSVAAPSMFARATCRVRARGARDGACLDVAGGPRSASGSSSTCGQSCSSRSRQGADKRTSWCASKGSATRRRRGCMVALGTTISTSWILAANSWMQTPDGVAWEHGRLIVTDWMRVIGNPSWPVRLPHMLLAAYLTAAFLVSGVSAWYLLRRRETTFAGARGQAGRWKASGRGTRRRASSARAFQPAPLSAATTLSMKVCRRTVCRRTQNEKGRISSAETRPFLYISRGDWI